MVNDEKEREIIHITEDDLGATEIDLDPSKDTVIIISTPDCEFSE